MASTFATWRASKLLPPLAGPMDELFAYVFGTVQDDELALLRVAALSRLPATCPDDGLDLLGQGFVLPRFPGEPHDSYRARLVAAWDTYDVGGAPDAITASLHAYGIPDVRIVREEDAGYPNVWYSRFDVYLGPDFGSVAVTRFEIGPIAAETIGSWTVPAVGATVIVQINGNPFAVGDVIYIGQAGYYQVAGGLGAGFMTVQNLGGAVAACTAAGFVAGLLGTAANKGAPGATIATGQQVVRAGAPGIIGQTRIGIAIVSDSQRVGVKAQILRWKAAHGYAGRVFLSWDSATHPSTYVGWYAGVFYIGRMIGLNMTIGLTPIGGYDRS